jgi:thiol-disulfide isomerase/thioredoxin
MKYLHINPNNKKDIDTFNEHTKSGKKSFVLIYLEGCGPCNMTRPEWKKIENVTKNKYDNNDVAIVDIDQELLKEIKGLNIQPKGFPTMIYVSDNGKVIEDYEDSTVDNKDRSIDSFIKWIETKVDLQKGGKRTKKYRNRNHKKKTMKKNIKGGKWSLKYKKSINCKRPKGFSQRQYCKYGRKK